MFVSLHFYYNDSKPGGPCVDTSTHFTLGGSRRLLDTKISGPLREVF